MSDEADGAQDAGPEAGDGSSGASIHPFPLDGELWAPDLTRRGAQDAVRELADATLELLQDWQAARATARR